MDINDYTYKHQIIRQADYLINQLSGNSINGVQLNPKTIFIIKIFAYVGNKVININDPPRFKELKSIINDFLNSKLTDKELLNYINYLEDSLNNINIGGALLIDILDQLEFLIILKYLNQSLNFLDTGLIKNLLTKINNIGNYEDVVCLLNLYMDNYNKDTFPSKPLDKIPLESLIELKLNEIISNTDREFYKKLKTRRFLFIKNVYDKLDLLDNNNILKPSADLIYSIFLAASVLKLLEYNNIISINKYESMNYLDKELDKTMVEKEIKNNTENNRKELMTFSLPFQKYADKFNTSLFVVVLFYSIIWLIFSIFLYFRIFDVWVSLLSILVVFTGYLLEESYIKSYKKNK